jgi:hypothetical protein
MKKPAIIATIILLAALTGCANDAAPNPGGLSGDEKTVAELALAVDEPERDKQGEAGSVVGVYEWREGYSVLVREDGKNNDGDYINYHAYGYEPAGDDWELLNDAPVFSDFHPVKQPEIATCMALADEYSERDACATTE